MKQNFIKVRKDSVKLDFAFASASGDNFSNEDIKLGTLVVGSHGEGKLLAMGWLRGMTQDETTGEILYEIVNAVEGDEYSTCIRHAMRVNSKSVPLLAAKCTGDCTPVVGRVFACNGDMAKLDLGDDIGYASTEFIYRLEPLFQETK